MTNHYVILGIAENASDAEIKAAFKKKAVIYHPDKNAGDEASEEMFKMVNLAYQVLSDPYERARYDLKLRFGEVKVNQGPPPRYRSPQRRYGYPGGPIDHRTNDIATLWAFGISLGIAVVVMTVMQVYNMYKDYQRDVMLTERRVVFEKAKDQLTAGAIISSLTTLETLGTFHDEEKDIRLFKEDVLADILQSGTEKFFTNRFKEAIHDFEIYEHFAPNTRLSFELLYADAHMKAGNHDDAISRFNKIILQGNNTIENNLKVASIYLEGKKDYTQAMNHYEIAGKMAIEGYKSLYGDAYPLLLSPRNIPTTHFEIFHGMARCLFNLGNYDRALKAIKWNSIMWPSYPENHLLRGQIFEAQGRRDRACREFNLAVQKGWDFSIKCPGY